MYHDYLFIISHLGTHLGPLRRGIAACPDICINQSTAISYTTPLDLDTLRIICERQKRGCRVCADILLFNHTLKTWSLSDICIFLYYLGDPAITISSLIDEHHYDAKRALDYYAFRLQRMVAMSRVTQNNILLTWDTLNGEKFNELSHQLKLRNKIYFSIEGEDTDVFKTSDKNIKTAQQIYEKYLKKIQASFSLTSSSTC